MALVNGSIKVKGRARLERHPFQENVLDIQVDNTLDPGATPAAGDRYIITNSASLHANFGTITGVGNGDIVEYEGSAFVIVWDASVNGEGAQLWVEDVNKWYEYDGSSWTELNATVSVGNGLSGDGSSGSPIVVDLVASGGLKFVSGDIAVEPADIAGLGLEDDGSDNLQVKVDATGGANLALAINRSSNGLAVKVDAASIDGNGSNQLEVKDAGITTAKLATDSVTSAKIDYADAGLRQVVATWANADGTSKVVTHSLNTKNILVELFDDDTGETVYVDSVVRTDVNTLTLTATQAPTTSYTVLIKENVAKS